jgi:hypothetical protein
MAPTGTVIVEFTAPADGSYRLLATAANGAGQAGPGFGEVWVQVDRATVTPTAVFDPSSDTGASYSDRLTSDTTPAFMGSAEAGSKIEVYVDGVLTGTTLATDGSAWRLEHFRLARTLGF